MKCDNTAYYDLCMEWADSFGVKDRVLNMCHTRGISIRKVLDEIGIPLTYETIADIFEVEYNHEFYVTYDSAGYFPEKNIGDMVDMADLLLLNTYYSLIQDYVKDNFSNR